MSDEKTDVDYYNAYVSKDYVKLELDKRFIELYGDGFEKFSSVLKKFEKKIEEAVLFGTISDVYNIIKKYSEFDIIQKKLSDIVIR
jgi:hypothetical protein